MAELTPSPFAPTAFPSMSDVNGMTQKTTNTATKYKDRDDLLVVTFDQPATVAGVFTQSSTAAAAVDWCRNVVKGGQIRALVVNAGNANAFTGQTGEDTVTAMADSAAQALGVKPTDVAVASTGVIGEVIDNSKMCGAIQSLCQSNDTATWEQAARSILTTDTYAKAVSHQFSNEDGTDTTISGYAKGSGMIQPNMATMLCFVYTDAAIEPSVLQSCLREVNARTFNCITVDSDTSTNDTVLVAATGTNNGAAIDDLNSEQARRFSDGLFKVLRELALLVVKDGEGISHLMTISVTGANTDADAHQVALSIGNSPLVKTAIAGNDANWGRIVMAIGKTSALVDKNKIAVRVGDHQLAQAGNPRLDVDIPALDEYMHKPEIEIGVDLGLGHGTATVWASDLTHGYISINADYRS